MAKLKKEIMIGREKIFLFIFVGVIVITMALFCFEKYPQDKITFGVKIAGINLGGKSVSESEKILKEKITNFNKKQIPFILEKKSKKTITPQKLKTEYQLSASLRKAFAVGKNKSFLKNIKEKIWAVFGKHNIVLGSNISEKELNDFLSKNFGDLETLPENAKVEFETKTLSFQITEPKDGNLFPRKKIKNTLEEGFQKLKINKICLASEKKENCFSPEKSLPDIQTKQATKAKEMAEAIIKSGPYLVLTDEKSFSIKVYNLGQWFVFEPKKEDEKSYLETSLNEDLIKQYLTTLSQGINTEPQNPTLSFQEGEIKIISPPKNGKVLDIEKGARLIKENILAKRNRITISTKAKEPEITEQKIKDLKIEKLIAFGTSNFSGSPKNRIHNIKVSSEKFNGLLIRPSEIVSFNKILGPVGAAQGYLPELVIKNNKTVREYGGGICQVSTTVFRSAVNSGMEILERQAHAYPVRYYSPHGFDATVYVPKPDLVFKNNTPGYILLQKKIIGNILTFEIYGQDDSREVIVKGPYQYAFGSDGSMKARLEMIVKKEGNTIYQKTFLSSYKSPKLFPVEQRNPLE